MKIKKVFILISFVVVSILAGKASASACSMYDTYGCYPQNYVVPNYPTLPTYPVNNYVYEPSLPQIYGNTSSSVSGQQNSNYVDGGALLAYNTANQQQISQNQVTPKTYVPASPLIYNGDGTYTEQNTGTTYGTKNNTTSTSNNSSDTSSNSSNTSILGSIFGTKKDSDEENGGTEFTNGLDSSSQISNSSVNMRALVNSKGLAMGSESISCNSTDGQYLLMYKNITGVNLTNGAIRISFPDGIVPTNNQGGSYSERDNTLTFFLGNLIPNQEGQVLIPVKKESEVNGVARSEFVYTMPDQNQDMVVSYAFGEDNCNLRQNQLGASAIGSGSNFLSGTLLGWLFLALLVSAFIYLVRFFLIRKETSHDAHSNGH
jgi:hypothetical protein